MVLPDAVPPALLGLRVRLVDGEPKIIDFLSAGTSLIKAQRDDFAAILTHRGVEGLLSKLRSKVAPQILLGANP
jgi:ABC-type transporter MlaC component